MQAKRYTLPAAELLLVFPAGLFMTALFVRNIQPPQHEPAHTAQQIVNWYAQSGNFGLWVLLMAMPSLVLVTGCGILIRRWKAEPDLRQAACQTATTLNTHLSAVLIGAATVAAGGFLSIVALHVLSD